MIELRNIKKTYKSKKGLSTDALKGININFSEKGLTFILGKSGSGKSTLLNILGGLDNYTSGDIIVNGKSTKDFKEKDWDAYRNTYMGFVFQDFNLLDNYTVEENVKLALELQHKKANKNEVMDVLKKMDLSDVLKRKPNELSGGQKQRIAIARALIKNPEIILLDEPTGNLDSNTSIQIFDLLKALSKDKLIVVVSHDEENANKYADRIIKISDGLIESDNGTNDINGVNQFKLVNAKLPFFYSFKMGLGNLLHKKIRLIFSMLLIILCLVCFGTMISTLNTDMNKEYINSLEERGATDVFITKYEKKVDYEELFKEEMKTLFSSNNDDNLYPKTLDLDDNFIGEVSEKTNMKWYASYKVINNFEEIIWSYKTSSTDNTILYYYIGDSLIEKNISLLKADEELIKDLKVIGRVPAKDDEIMISSYIADQIMFYGISSKKLKTDTKVDTYKPISYEQIINDNIYINFGDLMYVKVTGIIDYTDELKKYSKLREVKAATMWDMVYESDEYNELDELYTNLIDDGAYLTNVYVSDTFINKLQQKEENMSNSTTKVIYNTDIYDVEEFGYINSEFDVFNGTNKIKLSNLNNNEIIINLTMLDKITKNDFSKKWEESLLINPTLTIDLFLNKYIKDNNIIGKVVKTSIKDSKIYNDTANFADYTIVGVINDSKDYGIVYYNKDKVKKLIGKTLIMNKVFTKVSNAEELKTILQYYPIDNSDILSSSKYSNELLSSIYITILLELVGKYGTLFFLVFATILLMNFISNSIKFRKKEIGILRAIGCRSVDIIKMFVYECLVLMMICLLVSFIIIPKIILTVNNYISSIMYTNINIMKFGLVQMVGVTLVMALIVLFASVIPIKKLTKKKPIDTILDK